MEYKNKVTRLGIISLILSLIGLFGIYIWNGLYFLIFNHPLGSYYTGLILTLITSSIGILGLILGVFVYTGKNKDALGLAAIAIGIISILFNGMAAFCAAFAGMN